MGPTRIPISVLPLGLWTGMGTLPSASGHQLHRAADCGRDPRGMERMIKGLALSVPLTKRVHWGRQGKVGA